MLLSKSCAYAIRAMLLITVKEVKDGKRFIPIRELADELELSFHFLTKILQTLTEAKILESFRGPNGGVGLAQSPKQLTLRDIIKAIDGTKLFSECALGLPGCGDRTPCPLHDVWAKRRKDLLRMFEQTTLENLAKQIKTSNLRK